jgi:hypothetical protein
MAGLDLTALEDLPPGGQRFFTDLEEGLDLEEVRSVLVFGSTVTGDVAAVSDIDLLIVLEDGSEYAGEVRGLLDEIAPDLTDETRPDNAIEARVQRMTGMFRSGFTAEAGDVRDGRFEAIFETSALARLAPWRIVLARVFEQAEPVYGDMIEPDWDRIGDPREQPVRELMKDIGMTGLLSLAQIPYQFVSGRATEYSLEAYKWTLYNCAYLLEGEATTLSGSMDALSGERMDERFLELRAEPERSPGFVLQAPLSIAQAHLAVGRAIVGGES